MTVSRRTAVMIGLGVLAAVATAVAFAVPFNHASSRPPTAIGPGMMSGYGGGMMGGP